MRPRAPTSTKEITGIMDESESRMVSDIFLLEKTEKIQNEENLDFMGNSVIHKDDEEEKELIQMLEADAKETVPTNDFDQNIQPELKKSIKLQTGAYLQKRLSTILKKDDEAIVKIQNLMQE